MGLCRCSKALAERLPVVGSVSSGVCSSVRHSLLDKLS